MSGFVGLVNLDGQPIDRPLLAGMAAAMAFRGPDRQRTWCDGRVGLAHALLETADAPARDQQPFTLDGLTWIVADARIDGHSDLAGQLEAHGQRVDRDQPDAALILKAYSVWGEACAEHLIGDFAFAIWDGRRRLLVAARDQLGVKSLFYSAVGRTVVVSNTLECVRRHPAVSDRLNDLAVADFLLFQVNHDPSTTVFADVHRIPPAHTAVWSADAASVARYWTLPVDEPVYYRRPDDYTDRFNELMDAAVSDRLRGRRVGIFMSGGIDSSTMAAASRRVLQRRGQDGGVRAFTTTVDGLDRDEGRYAQLVAGHLQMPITLLDGGDAAFDREWSERPVQTPEPVREVTTLLADREAYRTMSRFSPVAFYGEGPDNALQYEWQAYLRHLCRSGRYLRLAGDVARHVRRHRRLPLQSLGRRLVRARRERGRWDTEYPNWISPDLERRFDLRGRWERLSYLQPAPIEHPARPAAYASFWGPEWEHLFRGFDPEVTGAPLDVRHPYLDLRVLRYLLSVPPVPWCRAKHLIRHAMRRELPPAVLNRPKAGMSGDPDYEVARRIGLPPLVPEAELERYVVPARVPDVSASSMIAFRADFRARALNHWLKSRNKDRRHGPEEIEHDVAHA